MNDHPVDGVGYLEQREYRRFVWAWEHAGKIASFLYGAGKVNSAGETDVRVDSSSAPSTPLDATWLAADEISSHLHALNAYPDSETAAKHKIGQYHAIELGRCVSTADRRWPMHDKAHFINHMRCGGCGELTLAYRPPRFPLDGIKVDCWCGHELTEDEYSAAVLRIELQMKEAA